MMVMSASKQSEASHQMAEFIGYHFFAGREPGVIGAVLAQLMATFLGNHKIPDDLAKQERLREEMLTMWCDTVRELIAADEMEKATKQ